MFNRSLVFCAVFCRFVLLPFFITDIVVSDLLRFTATVYLLGNILLLDICMYDCMPFSNGRGEGRSRDGMAVGFITYLCTQYLSPLTL